MSRFDDAIRDMQEKRHKAIQKVCTVVEAEAKLRVKVKTGNLKRSISHKVESIGNETKGRVGFPQEYGMWLEKGTPPHTIAAKDGKNLKFKVAGKWVSKPEVNHPGQKPQPFLIPAIEENIAMIQGVIWKELEV
jgi:HK97 gp10 family phage protein